MSVYPVYLPFILLSLFISLQLHCINTENWRKHIFISREMLDWIQIYKHFWKPASLHLLVALENGVEIICVKLKIIFDIYLAIRTIVIYFYLN